jgi:hypothetical protein
MGVHLPAAGSRSTHKVPLGSYLDALAAGGALSSGASALESCRPGPGPVPTADAAGRPSRDPSRVVVLLHRRPRERHLVDGDLVGLTLRELQVAAIPHHVPSHRRRGAARSAAAALELPVEIEGDVPPSFVAPKWCQPFLTEAVVTPVLKDVPPKSVVERSAAVVGQDPAAARCRGCRRA